MHKIQKYEQLRDVQRRTPPSLLLHSNPYHLSVPICHTHVLSVCARLQGQIATRITGNVGALHKGQILITITAYHQQCKNAQTLAATLHAVHFPKLLFVSRVRDLALLHTAAQQSKGLVQLVGCCVFLLSARLRLRQLLLLTIDIVEPERI